LMELATALRTEVKVRYERKVEEKRKEVDVQRRVMEEKKKELVRMEREIGEAEGGDRDRLGLG